MVSGSVSLQRGQTVGEIALGDDAIGVEHSTLLLAADLQDDALGHAPRLRLRAASSVIAPSLSLPDLPQENRLRG